MNEPRQVTSERNRLIAMGIALVVLAILVSTAHRLPDANRFVTGYLTVGGIIRLVMLFIMLGIVLSARPSLAVVAGYYAHRGFKTKELPERREVASHVTGLATEIVNVIVIAILWPIAARIVDTLLLMDVERTFDWVPILVTVAFVAILLWRLYLGYQALRPILDATSGAKASTSCPSCGTSNTAGAKFCSSCGAELVPAQVVVKAQTISCPKCGAENKAGAKFCQNCGSALAGE
jgi:hypothetical protein